ncbi:MAG: PEP-CTERM sorting domain-containing protein [Sedimentisphaeraceae bacterium JB056]
MKKLIFAALLVACRFSLAAMSWNVIMTDADKFTASLLTDEQVNAVSIALMTSDSPFFSVDSSSWNPAFTSTQPVLDLSGFGSEGYGAATANITSPGVYTTGTLITINMTFVVGDIVTISDLPAFGMSSYVSTQSGGQQSFSELGIDEIFIIPEPMTMALLGLGGLFIHRRRA